MNLQVGILSLEIRAGYGCKDDKNAKMRGSRTEPKKREKRKKKECKKIRRTREHEMQKNKKK